MEAGRLNCAGSIFSLGKCNIVFVGHSGSAIQPGCAFLLLVCLACFSVTDVSVDQIEEDGLFRFFDEVDIVQSFECFFIKLAIHPFSHEIIE